MTSGPLVLFSDWTNTIHLSIVVFNNLNYRLFLQISVYNRCPLPPPPFTLLLKLPNALRTTRSFRSGVANTGVPFSTAGRPRSAIIKWDTAPFLLPIKPRAPCLPHFATKYQERDISTHRIFIYYTQYTYLISRECSCFI